MQPPSVLAPAEPSEALPDHTQLPEKDGTFVQNFQEYPQSSLLTGSLWPRLLELHPDGQFCIGQDSGIYYRYTQPPLDGCKAPDWFYVPGVPPMLNGTFRRSYVLWQEVIRPLIVIEYASGNGQEERDTTPYRGKFWVYEKAIAAAYYAIFESERASVELYKLEEGRYRLVEPNASNRLPIHPLRVELGLWKGTHQGMDALWLRVWDSATGLLLPSEEERAEAERQRAEAERQRAEAERQRAETAESLLDDARHRHDEECERAETERRRAEAEQQPAEKLADLLRAHGINPDAPPPS